MAHRHAGTVAVLVLLVACAGEPSADATADTTIGSTPRPAAMSITPERFRSLRWIEGAWQGSGAPEPFFESYRFIDDSTLMVRHHSTAALTDTTAEDSVTWRGGFVRNIGIEAAWVASDITDTSIAFSPESGTSGFTWSREGPDAWVATIARETGAPTVYRMRRIRP